MTDETPIDENAAVAEIAKAMEAEGLAESETLRQAELDAKYGLRQPTYLPGVIPLDDLRARLAACVKAGVISYRDGPLELKFDPDARTRNAGTIQTPGEIVRF